MELGLNYHTVRKVSKFYDATGEVKPLLRPGRPPKWNKRDHRRLKQHIKRDRQHRRQAPSTVIKELDLDVCIDMLIHELKKLNLNRRAACKKP
jgi:transposase